MYDKKLMCQRLRNLRLAHDLSLRDLADKIGTSDSALCLAENGKRYLSIIMAANLASYYGVSIDYLIGSDKHER